MEHDGLTVESKKKVRNKFLCYKIYFHWISGTIDECKLAQAAMEKTLSINSTQWSSAETELSEDEDENEVSNYDNKIDSFFFTFIF